MSTFTRFITITSTAILMAAPLYAHKRYAPDSGFKQPQTFTRAFVNINNQANTQPNLPVIQNTPQNNMYVQPPNTIREPMQFINPSFSELADQLEEFQRNFVQANVELELYQNQNYDELMSYQNENNELQQTLCQANQQIYDLQNRNNQLQQTLNQANQQIYQAGQELYQEKQNTRSKLEGVIVFLSVGLLSSGGMRAHAIYRDYYNNKYTPAVLAESDKADVYLDRANQYYKLSRFLLYSAAGIWAYSVLDAYVDAHIYNAQQQVDMLHIDDGSLQQLKSGNELSKASVPKSGYLSSFCFSPIIIPRGD